MMQREVDFTPMDMIHIEVFPCKMSYGERELLFSDFNVIETKDGKHYINAYDYIMEHLSKYA